MINKSKKIHKNCYVRIQQNITDQIIVWFQWHDLQLDVSVFHISKKSEALEQFNKLSTKYHNGMNDNETI